MVAWRRIVAGTSAPRFLTLAAGGSAAAFAALVFATSLELADLMRNATFGVELTVGMIAVFATLATEAFTATGRAFMTWPRGKQVLATTVLGALPAACLWPYVALAIGTDHGSPTWCGTVRAARAIASSRSILSCTGRLNGESGTIGACRTLTDAQAIFEARHGRYANDLEELLQENLISGPFPRRAFGYVIAMKGTERAWHATAEPGCLQCLRGSRFFYVDESGFIRFSTTGRAGPKSQAIGE
jgi:hypothetical protein